ncbi:integrase [Xanthomonas phage PBR31]|uniref:Integrase n=1 Tax=Xanthomonas phage PPDBI TaxID=2723911 RepID=A0A6H0X5Q8_9CAUD|nr:integrase [Ralstonia pickettii]NYS09367.1 integrase [Ralstonia pickettii]QIN95352.1 integrase [Xanthomonas phage PBR31]QIW89400.1 integrase [Xanthomonas phage PPDBI]
MPPKRKAENRGLPLRWQMHHGAYYYRVPPGLESHWDGKKRFRLGSSLPEAYRAWSERIGTQEKAGTIGELLDRYALEEVPKKEPSTQNHHQLCIGRLRLVFGDWALAELKPRHVYEYVDARTKEVKKPDGTVCKVPARPAGKKEIEVLSHAFTMAVAWGYIDRHPFKHEVRFKGEAPRDRYVEDWELDECMALQSRRLKGSVRAAQAYIALKRITGMARGDLLRINVTTDLKDDGIHIQRHKTRKSTGKRTVYAWTPELREAVDAAMAARPVHISRWLFCNRDGECYINEETGRAGGWESLWSNFMARVLAETKVKEPFNEHDIRAKTASDADSLEHAQALLSHADSRTTKRIYRRKAEVVMPLKAKK